MVLNSLLILLHVQGQIFYFTLRFRSLLFSWFRSLPALQNHNKQSRNSLSEIKYLALVTFDVTVKATSNDQLNLDMNFHWSRKAGRGQGEGSSRFEPESGLSSLYELRTTSEGTRSLDGSVHVRVAVVLNDDGDGGAAAWSAIAARLLLLSLRLLARSSQIRIYNESWETEDRCSSAS